MPKFLVRWELDQSRTPEDAQARANLWKGMIATIKQQMAQGLVTDWGSFPAEGRGYAVGQGSVEEMTASLLPYVPFVKFEVHPALGPDEMLGVINKTSGA